MHKIAGTLKGADSVPQEERPIAGRMGADSAPQTTILRERGLEAPYTTTLTRDEELTNQLYYDAVTSTITKPTVEGEIEAMYGQGNARYVDSWKGFLPTAREEVFETYNHHAHEITHLSARIPHSIQGEMWGLAFEVGLIWGVDMRQLDPQSIAIFQKYMTKTEDDYIILSTQKYHTEPSKNVSRRDWAVYMAAGMYLKEKMTRFVRDGMVECPHSEQLAFCAAYANHEEDHAPPMRGNVPLHAEDFHGLDEEDATINACLTAPNALIHLSPQEWKEIRGVALGMLEPEQSHYPQRLKAVKEALVHTGMFFDRKAYAQEYHSEPAYAKRLARAETREAGKIAAEQHARISSSYLAPLR